MTHVFTIPVAIPSANELKRALYGGNKRRYKKLREAFGWALVACARDVPAATGPREVRIVRLMPKFAKMYDHDNLVAGAKPLLDEMVRVGILVGDRNDQVKVTYGQERGDGGCTRIEVSL